jgi:hypothetical protein
MIRWLANVWRTSWNRSRAGPSSSPARRAARASARFAVAAYHESELGRLIERVREGLARYDAGEIDALELDDLIHRYKRATQKLWSFCTGSGVQLRRRRGRSSGCSSTASFRTGGNGQRLGGLATEGAQASRSHGFGRRLDRALSSWAVRRLGDTVAPSR